MNGKTFASGGIRALLPSAGGIRLVCTWFLLSRLAIHAVGVIGATTFLHQRTLTTAHLDAINPAATWHQWDSLWYEDIARHGYAPRPDKSSTEARGVLSALSRNRRHTAHNRARHLVLLDGHHRLECLQPAGPAVDRAHRGIARWHRRGRADCSSSC